MPKKLNSEKVKQIQDKIALERNDLRYSLEDTAQNFNAVKQTAAEIGRNPLSLFVPEDSILRNGTAADFVKEKPLQAIAASFSAGLLTSYLIRKIRPDWKSLAAQTAKFIAASEATDKVKNKISEMSGEFIESLFSDNNTKADESGQVNNDFKVLH